jgi:hypothetical protein
MRTGHWNPAESTWLEYWLMQRGCGLKVEMALAVTEAVFPLGRHYTVSHHGKPGDVPVPQQMIYGHYCFPDRQ